MVHSVFRGRKSAKVYTFAQTFVHPISKLRGEKILRLHFSRNAKKSACFLAGPMGHSVFRDYLGAKFTFQDAHFAKVHQWEFVENKWPHFPANEVFCEIEWPHFAANGKLRISHKFKQTLVHPISKLRVKKIFKLAFSRDPISRPMGNRVFRVNYVNFFWPISKLRGKNVRSIQKLIFLTRMLWNTL